MKKSKTFLVILVFIVLAVISVIFLNTYNDKFYNKIDFKTTSHVINNTKHTYVDTIIYVALNEVNIDSVDILVSNLTPKLNANLGNDITLEACIIKNINDTYTLYIGDVTHRSAIKIISHEIIHLKQYNTLELRNNGRFPLWKNKPYSLEAIPYNNRPWEIEAFNKQDALISRINKILY